MDLSQLKRDPAAIQNCLKELEDGSLVATDELEIYFPCRFVERKLAEIEQNTYVVGFIAIVHGNRYAVMRVIAMLQTDPTTITTVTLDEEDYYCFRYDPGAKVIVDLNLVKQDHLVYETYNELVAKAKIPWYYDYDDMLQCMDTSGTYGGTSLNKVPVLTEILVSILARQPDHLTQVYREMLKSREDLKTKPVILPLQSVEYISSDTTNRVTGSFFNQAVISSIANPNDRQERIESVLVA